MAPKRQNQSQETRFNDFLAMAPEDDKTSPTKLDLMTFWSWLQNWQNQSQETRFDDFLAMAQEVDKTSPRKLDLMIFWPWLQKSTKPIPGSSI